MDSFFWSLIILISFLQVYCLNKNFVKIKHNIIRLHHSLLESQNINENDANISDTKVLVITKNASKHLATMKLNQPKENILRIGVKKGGCSGMSYDMNWVNELEILDSDHIEYFDNIKCAIDPKSLLFLFGMELDYSNELINGGFKFQNPNAKSSCGCGKSFGI